MMLFSPLGQVNGLERSPLAQLASTIRQKLYFVSGKSLILRREWPLIANLLSTALPMGAERRLEELSP